jgi:putative acetyltransferase
MITKLGAFIVFVYGDPQYYTKFSFKTNFAQNFSPPYTLQYPEGWHAMKLNSTVLPEGGKFKCVNSLNDPKLW